MRNIGAKLVLYLTCFILVMAGAHAICFDGATPYQTDEKRVCPTGLHNTAAQGMCQTGTERCLDSGSWAGVCEYNLPTSSEHCGDLVDNDCDGDIDEGCDFNFGVEIDGVHYYCGYADNVCPEDYEDPTSSIVISCVGDNVDPDCEPVRVSVEIQTTDNIPFDLQEATNNVTTNITNKTFDDPFTGTFATEVIVDYSGSASTSRTVLTFTRDVSTLNLREITFDARPLAECLPAPPSQANEPCYHFPGNNELHIYHPLSLHVIYVEFDTELISLGTLLLVTGLVLMPLLVLKVVRTANMRHVDLHLGLFEHKVHTPHTDLDKVKVYIENQLKKGHTKREITEHLLRQGWKRTILDTIEHEVHTPKDFKRLEGYLHMAIEKGYSKKDIFETLEQIGWQKKQIEQVLNKIKEAKHE